jgi:hypothetical protein
MVMYLRRLRGHHLRCRLLQEIMHLKMADDIISSVKGSMEPIPFILLIHPDFSSGSNCNRLTNYHSETCNDRQLVWWEAALCSYGKSSPSIGPRNGDWDMVHRQ